MKKTPSEKIGNIAPFGLRMLPDLKARIEEAAADSGRSLNAEIVARLEQSFDPLVLNVRKSGDIYGELEQIVSRVVAAVREEERKHQGPAPHVSQPDLLFHNADGTTFAIELKNPQKLDKRSAQALLNQLRDVGGVHFDSEGNDPRENVALLDQVALEWIRKRTGD